MNRHGWLRGWAAGLVLGLALPTLSHASFLYWDGGDADGSNGANGGSGTWDLATANWYPGFGPADQTWANASNDTAVNAVFGGTAGTVTLGTPVNAGALQFTTTGYTLTGSTLTLAGAPSHAISVSPTTTATVNSALAGTLGLVKTGTGTLVLGGSSSFTGGVFLNAGTTQIANTSNLGALANNVTFDGGTLQLGATQASARGLFTASGRTGTLDTNGYDLTFTGAFGGTAGNNAGGTFNKAGTGTLTFAGAGYNNTTFGTVNVLDGTVKLQQTSATNNGGGIWNVGVNGGTPNSAVLEFNNGGSSSINNPFTVNVYGSGQLNYNHAQGGGMNLNVSYGNANIAAGVTASGGTGGASLRGGTLTVGAGATYNLGYRLLAYTGTTATGSLITGAGSLGLSNGNGWVVYDTPGAAIDLDVPIVLTGAASFALGSNATGANSGAPSDSASVTRLSGLNTYTGTTFLGSGIVLLNGNASNDGATASVLGTGTSAVQLGTPSWGNTLSVLTDGAYTIARNFAWASGINANNYPTVGGNTADTSSFTGNFDLTNNGSTGGNLRLTATAGGTVTFSGDFSGAAKGITKIGAGTVILSGTNSYTGTTTVSAGTLQMGSTTALPGTAALTVSGGTLDLNGNSQSTGAVTLTSGTILNSGAAATLTGTSFNVQSGTVGGGVGLAGAATVLTKSTAGTVVLAAGNTYGGGTAISGGVLNIAADSSLGAVPGAPAAANINFTGSGTLQLASAAGAVSLAANRGVTLGATFSGTLHTNGSGNSLTGNGPVTGAGNLVVAGGGTVTLPAANGYTGSTTVSSGTLLLNGPNGALTSTSGVTVGQTATLFLDSDGVGNNNATRLNNAAPVTLSGGELKLRGNAAAATAETIGNVTANTGLSTVTLIGQEGASTPAAAIAAGTLTRTAPGTILFRGNGLGQGAAGGTKITFSSAPTLTNGILPYALADTSATGSGVDFATYDGTNGIQVYSGYTAGLGATNTVNYDVSTAVAGVTTRTVNAVKLSSGGSIAINSGQTLTLGSGGLLAVSGNNGISGGNLSAGSAALIVHAVGDLAIGSTVTNATSGGLIKNGTGTLTLTAANGYSGGTTVNQGTLKLEGGNDRLPTNQAATVNLGGTLDLNGRNQLLPNVAGYGTITNAAATDATLTIGNGSSSNTTTFYNVLTDSFGTTGGRLNLAKIGNGSIVMYSTNNTYSGTTSIYNCDYSGNSYLRIYGDGALGTAPASPTDALFINTRGHLQFGAAFALNPNRTIVLGTASSAPMTDAAMGQIDTGGNNVTIGSLIKDYPGGSGTLRKLGGGTLTLTNAGNSYSGGTVLWGGNLAVSSDACLGAAGTSVTLAGGSQTSPSLLRIEGTGFTSFTRPLTIGSGGNRWGGIEVADADTTVVIAGDIASGSAPAGVLAKAGPGTLRLTGNNSGLGGIVAGIGSTSNGTLEFTSAAALGGGSIYGNYSTSMVLKNISGGTITLPHSLQTVNNNFSLYFAGDPIILNGDINTGTYAPSISVATGSSLTLNGAINARMILNTATGSGEIILNPSAASTNTINSMNRPAGLACDNAFGNGTNTTILFNGTNLYATSGPVTIATPIQLDSYSSSVLTLSGANDITFTGAITYYNVNGGPIISTTGTGVATLAGSLTGTGSHRLLKNGAGVLALTGTNTTTWTMDIQGGALRAQPGTGLSPNSFLKLNGGVLEMNGTFNRTLGASGGTSFQWTSSGGFAAFGGPLSVDVNGGGADNLVWASTANFLPSGATLILGSPTANDVVTFTDNISFNGAQRTIQVDDNASSANDKAVISGNLTGAGVSGLIKTGGGVLELTGTNSYAGKTTVNAGTLRIAGDAFLGAVPGAAVADQLKLDGGTLNSSATFALAANRGVTLGSGALFGFGNGTLQTDPGTTLTVNGVIGGYGSLTKSGAGTLVLANTGNTYLGQTYVTAGTLQIAAEGALGTAPASPVADQLTLDGGTLQNTANVTFAATRCVTLGAGHGTIITDPSTTLTVNGPVVGSGSLTKTGTGTLQLNGLSTYTGTTTVLAGTLQVPGRLFNNGSDKVFIGADGNGVLGDAVGDVRTVRSVAAGGSYAGYGSTILGGVGTRADVLAGTNSGGATGDLTMAWRTAATADTVLGVRSDVIGLTTPQAGDTFVLQMSYDEALLNGTPELGLYVGWLSGGAWINAVAGNSGGAAGLVLGPWAAGYGLGTYGLDMTSNVVWAVLNHNSEFAVIPEPSALVLLALAATGLLSRRRPSR